MTDPKMSDNDLGSGPTEDRPNGSENGISGDKFSPVIVFYYKL